MYGMAKTTLYLPDDLKRAIELEARRQSLSEAEVIRQALRSSSPIRLVAAPAVVCSRAAIRSRTGSMIYSPTASVSDRRHQRSPGILRQLRTHP